MAKPSYVWGIDVGQCALKALRCTVEDGQVVADAFDYIEYPKILSQPEADPEALIREALEQFLSRNSVKGDKVAISVPGQSGLAKFFKPPPVDVKRIPHIVQYEAKQQIPFPLEEVIWDFQKMAGGQEIDGFAIDTEVGLFAMKREQVYRALKPFERADVELDIVQLAPLGIYNFISHDVLTDIDPDFFDPDDPPESMVVLAMGTDATDLVITNGFRVWQRSIPLGGNHFTKQLTKELKLTFAKAEHLKRNARQAEDPKTVFQAMRPIFNDMVTEVQRSIGYFQGIDRKAKIKGVVLLGNTVKLPGLQQYVAKNLGYEVINFDKFNRLSGPSVLSSPAFSDNLLAYGVSYGLCLQGLGKGLLSTNLLPKEIQTQRMIRAKKPWAIASVAALMLACLLNFGFNYRVWSQVQPTAKSGDVAWEDAESQISNVKSTSDSYKKDHRDKVAQLTFLAGVGREVVGAADRRLLWLELLKTIDAVLPWTPGADPRVYVDYKTVSLDEREELHIDYIESQYFSELADWYSNPTVQTKYAELQIELTAARQGSQPAAEQAPPDGQAAEGQAAEGQAAQGQAAQGQAAQGQASGNTEGGALGDGEEGGGPQGAGWVIEMKGYHYHNAEITSHGAIHVRNTLMLNLEDTVVELPVDKMGRTESFTTKELGISFAVLFDEGPPRAETFPNPEFRGQQEEEEEEGEQSSGNGGGFSGGFGAKKKSKSKAKAKGTDDIEVDAEGNPMYFNVKKYSFTVQFCWQPIQLSERLAMRAEKLRLEQEAAAAAAAELGQSGTENASSDGGDSSTTENEES